MTPVTGSNPRIEQPTAFALEIQSEGTWPQPIEIRLRAFLKVALRAFGLRVVNLRELPASNPEPSTKEITR